MMVANTPGKGSHDPCEVDAQERHADETSACRDRKTDSGQRSRRLLLARRFLMEIPAVARARRYVPLTARENDSMH
jgi:hypothetical protein